MSKNSDDKLYVEWLENCITSEAFGNDAVQFSADCLAELIAKLCKLIREKAYISTKKSYIQLLTEAEEILAEYLDILNTGRQEHIEKIVEKQSAWLKDFGKKINKDYSIPKTLLTSVLFFPITTNTDYKAMTEKELQKIRDYFSSSAKLAYVMKQDTSQTEEQFRVKSEKLKSSWETDERTLNTAMFRATTYSILKSNKQKVVYSSVLDTHTCLLCADYSGKVFEISEAPALPQHENCRCTLIQVEAVGGSEILSLSDFIEKLDDDA